MNNRAGVPVSLMQSRSTAECDSALATVWSLLPGSASGQSQPLTSSDCSSLSHPTVKLA